MSTGYPSKKEKRSRSSSDHNNSFIKNVASRVSGLLPSTITKWFSSPSSSNGSAPVAESSDSSTEDEAPDSQITQPPSKRMRIHSPSTSNNYFTIEVKNSSTNTESVETFSLAQSPICKSTFRPDVNFVSTPLQTPKEEITVSEHETHNFVYNIQNSLSNIGKSVEKKRKSLFDIPARDNVYEKRPKLDSGSAQNLTEPYFKPGLLCSPFYAGQTKYGGAASSYMNQPNVKHRKNTFVRDSANNTITSLSQTTKYIMDLLENYSSPLKEAKRIPQPVRPPKKNLVDSHTMNKSYKHQELFVPVMAKILRIKQKTRLMSTTSAARQIIASHSSSQAFTPYPTTTSNRDNPQETSEKLTTKIKSRITRLNKDDNIVPDSKMTAPVQLPTAVLQIDQNNLPKFTLGTTVTESISIAEIIAPDAISETTNVPSGNHISNRISVSVTKSINNSEIVSKPQTILNENPYEFSNPVMIHVGRLNNSSQLPSYTFGSPERRAMEQSKQKGNDKFVTGTDLKTGSQSESLENADCRISNKADLQKCLSSVCNEQKQQERSDKCIDCEKEINIVNKSAVNLSMMSKWKCQVCLVYNDEGEDKCICCTEKKSTPPPVANVKSINNKHKAENNESDWKCNDCWLKNKSNADKCIACGGAKPTLKKSNEVSQQQNIVSINTNCDPTLKNNIHSQTDNWLCPICLVSNTTDRSMCICCDAEDPSRITEFQRNCFKFSKTPNTTSFKFGIDPNENITTKMSESSPETQLEVRIKEAETNNNIVSKPVNFIFGVSKQKTWGNSIVEDETIAEETPNETFKFGISKPLETLSTATNNPFTRLAPPSAGSKFSTAGKSIPPLNFIETDEKVQEVPNIEEPISSVPETTQRSVGLFGIPLSTSSVVTSMPTLVTFGQAEQSPNMQTLPVGTAIPADAKVPQSTFNFTGSGIKRDHIFSAAVTIPSTTSISFSTLQAPPTSVAFFQNSDPVYTSTLSFFTKSNPITSLFDKTETITTTVASPSLSSAGVFSFGSNKQNTQTEKPKFNFTFGNKTDVSPLFTLPTSSTGNILSGNGVPTATITASANIISGGSGLPTGSSIRGNGLSSHPLSSGLLAGSAKKENILWSPNNDLGSIKMSSGNSLEPHITNNLPVVPSGNLFGTQATKENTWSLNQNSSNDTMGSLKLPSGNSLESGNNPIGSAPGRMFGSPEKNENIWSLNNNNSNMFAPNAGTNILQKPATFAFGSSTPFNSNNVTGTASTFGNATSSSQHIFGMSSHQNNNNTPLFSTPTQHQTPPNIFGAQAPNPAPSMGMFGAANTGAILTFGNSNSSIQTYEATALNAVPAPTFNFGAQQTPGVFGFGQQQPQPQGVYNFGASAAGSPQRQFNIGTTGGATVMPNRRVIRKAVRRNTQR